MSLSLDTTNLTRPNEHLAVLLPKHLWKVRFIVRS